MQTILLRENCVKKKTMTRKQQKKKIKQIIVCLKPTVGSAELILYVPLAILDQNWPIQVFVVVVLFCFVLF